MCEHKNGFRLCTCEGYPFDIPGVNFVWRLYRYRFRKKLGMTGSVVWSVNELKDGFTADFVLEKINTRNCFDFEYEPVEKDAIKFFHNPNNSGYMCFVFENGRWRKGMIDPFFDVVEIIHTGILDEKAKT